RSHRIDALIISYTTDIRDRFDEVRSALQSLGIPHIYNLVNAVEQGGALGAQPGGFDIGKTGAEYISRIAHGEAPAEIPVQLSRSYDIAVHTERIQDFRGCDPRR